MHDRSLRYLRCSHYNSKHCHAVNTSAVRTLSSSHPNPHLGHKRNDLVCAAFLTASTTCAASKVDENRVRRLESALHPCPAHGSPNILSAQPNGPLASCLPNQDLQRTFSPFTSPVLSSLGRWHRSEPMSLPRIKSLRSHRRLSGPSAPCTSRSE